MIIQVYQRNYIDLACSILDKYLGEGCNEPERYYDSWKSDAQMAVYAAFSFDSGDPEMIGAITVKVVEDEDFDDVYSYFIDFNLMYKKIGFIESVAIEDGYKGFGYGKHLVITGETFLKDIGCSDLVALCWESGLDRQSLPLFKSLGYEEVEHFIQPWQGESCPVCGDDCKCNATLVHKEV